MRRVHGRSRYPRAHGTGRMATMHLTAARRPRLLARRRGEAASQFISAIRRRPRCSSTKRTSPSRAGHPNVAAVLNVIEDDGEALLRDQARRRWENAGTLAKQAMQSAVAIAMICDVLEGLEARPRRAQHRRAAVASCIATCRRRTCSSASTASRGPPIFGLAKCAADDATSRRRRGRSRGSSGTCPRERERQTDRRARGRVRDGRRRVERRSPDRGFSRRERRGDDRARRFMARGHTPLVHGSRRRPPRCNRDARDRRRSAGARFPTARAIAMRFVARSLPRRRTRSRRGSVNSPGQSRTKGDRSRAIGGTANRGDGARRASRCRRRSVERIRGRGHGGGRHPGRGVRRAPRSSS